MEDFTDFLRLKKLSPWDKYDYRVKQLRRIRIGDLPNLTNVANLPNWANLANMANNPEVFANVMITLINMECYLLDKMLKSLEDKFVKEGGYTENLFKKRLSQRRNVSNH